MKTKNRLLSFICIVALFMFSFGCVSAEKLDDVQVCVGSAKEAEYYSGRSSLPEMAAVLADRGVRTVVIKAGPAGCYVRAGEQGYALPAVPLERVVDTTGAGDNFVAGFASEILRGSSGYS